MQSQRTGKILFQQDWQLQLLALALAICLPLLISINLKLRHLVNLELDQQPNLDLQTSGDHSYLFSKAVCFNHFWVLNSGLKNSLPYSCFAGKLCM